MTDKREKASDFAKRWRDRGSEASDTREFWEDLLENVLDVPQPYKFIQSEKKVKVDKHNRRIDVYIPKTRVLIEQKDKSINLDHKGQLGTAYEQARLYESELPLPEKPKWIITCNFKEFRIYDRVHPEKKYIEFSLEELPDNINSLEILVDNEIRRIAKEEEASIKAAEKISDIYNSILNEYENPTKEELDSLNIFCVRLAFCMYLEDSGIFKRDSFKNLIIDYSKRPWDLRDELFRLFVVLDTPVEDREKYLANNLKHFPYVNGGLFAKHNLQIPQFTKETVKNIEEACNFGWENISPAIFGAAYESTVNPVTRRQLGMHYTSQENIHKVIDPLFLDDLKEEVEQALNKTVEGGARTKAINKIHDKLANLQFLDPACGSGNFLTETYIELRRLENLLIADQFQVGIKELGGTQIVAKSKENINDLIRVKLENFHGIEIEPFAVAVAQTSLWIAEIKMKKETENIINTDVIKILPLKAKPGIHCANALRIDWNTIVSANECNYVMGNPPYLGYSQQSLNQKKELKSLLVDERGKAYPRSGKLDYVSGWFYKAASYIQDTNIEVAFVATNSITQGDQVEPIWKPLRDRFGLSINFAYRTFVWDNGTKDKAHVHVVIIGFSQKPRIDKYIYSVGERKKAKNINFYLMDSPNLFISSFNKPISVDAPLLIEGNRPADGGALIIEEKDYENFIKKEPKSADYIRPLYGSREFIQGKKRYCLWLVNATPNQISKMPLVQKRVEQCRLDRLNGAQDRVKLADTPHLFRETNEFENALILPLTSSENRHYIPIDFLEEKAIPNNGINVLNHASNYHFGILTSNVFMAWVRAFCGRLKSDCRITIKNLYNPFPWPKLTLKQRERIEKTAQHILDVRAKYPDSSLANLYNETLMPLDLRKAHEVNDRAVMAAYGFSYDMTEDEIVAELMKLYQKAISKN